MDKDEPSWVAEHALKERRSAVLEQKSKVEARLRQIRAKELQQKQHYENGEPKTKRMRPDETSQMLERDDEAQFELDEYNSDDECMKVKATSHLPVDRGLSSTSLQLMQKLGLASKLSAELEDLLPTDELKVFYCSRTHSQLTQFIQEVRRVDLPPSSWMIEHDNSLPNDPDGRSVVKHVPLGSRKNLCINAKVSKLGSAPAMNERCLELQQPDTPKDQKCPFVPNKENETLVNEFRDHALAKVRDIEDLGSLGKKLGICPYYASRATIKPSEVGLPINFILTAI
jgi:chromosome transmission fidelity protein 1